MSGINPGTSINFDAQALHDAEEAEYQREEAERQNELRAALMDAFDDDLSDEDSDVSRDHGRSMMSSQGDLELRRRATPTDNENDTGSDHYQDPVNAHHALDPQTLHSTAPTPVTGPAGPRTTHTSTPMSGEPPPLTTPATMPHYVHQGYHTQWNMEPANHNYPSTDNNPYDFADPYNQYQGYQGHYVENTDTVVHPDYDGREVEGANEEDYFRDNNNMYQPVQSQPYHYHYHNGHGTESTDYHHYDYHENHGYGRDVVPTRDTESSDSRLSPPRPQAKEPPAGHELDPQTSDSGHLDAYRVTYRVSMPEVPYTETTRPVAESPEPTTISGNEAQNGQARPTTPGGEYDKMQRDFLHAGSGHQMEQLQILYAARGRKIEELQRSYKSLQEDSDRELRILKHKLTLTQDERDGLSNSLDQCQLLLKDSRHRESDLEGQAAAMESQIQALSNTKQELIKKLEAHESTIENLNVQLCTLEASESLARARDQHEAIVSGITQKHEREIYVLKETLDAAQRENEEKVSEISSLKKQVIDLLKSSENAQIDRADTINRLSRSLEESQRQCQDLLEAGQGQEMSRLKIQLQEVIAGKSISEDMNSALHSELHDLKEQVMMYESASQFGLFSNTTTSSVSHPKTSTQLDDSYAQLGIRGGQAAQPQWQTPESGRSETPILSNEATIHGLKNELERCLGMYKNKREQVSQIQESLKVTKANLDKANATANRMEEEAKQTRAKLKALEEKVGDSIHADNPREALAKKEIDRLLKDKEILSIELEEVRTRLAETATNEEQISEINRDLNTQMTQMIKDFDEDKRTALEKCQENILKHHEDNTKRIQQEFDDKFTADKLHLEREWQDKINNAIEEARVLRQELDDVKSLYVSVCHDKDQLQLTLETNFAKQMEEQLEQMKADFEKEKATELEMLREEAARDNESSLATAKEKWLKETNEDLKKQIESEVAKSKADWFSEHQTSRDQAVERANKVSNLEWQQKWDTELQAQLEKEFQKVQEEWDKKKQVDIEKTYEEKLIAAKQIWKESELREAVREAVEEKSKHFEQTLAIAKDQWLSEHRNTQESIASVEQSERMQLNQQVEEAKSELKQELDMLRKEKLSVDKELSHKQEMWLQEKQNIIKQKDAERRKALLEVQEQSEQEYRQFLTEHQDTLTRALSAAHTQHATEIENLKKQHQEELDALSKSASKSAEVKQQHALEIEQIEKEWQAKVDALNRSHEEERESLMTTHRENMAKALDEARNRWQKKLEMALEQNERTVLLERERQWAAERAEYLAQITEQDQIIQSADAHMESEVARLQEELQQQHEQQLEEELTKFQENLSLRDEVQKHQDLLKLDGNQSDIRDDHLQQTLDELRQALSLQHQEEMQTEIQKIEEIHKTQFDRLQKELTNKHQSELRDKLVESQKSLQSQHNVILQDMRQELERHFTEKVSSSQEEMDKILKKLEESRKQLKELYGKYTKDTKNLAKRIELLDTELRKCKEQLDSKKNVQDDLQSCRQQLDSNKIELDSKTTQIQELEKKIREFEKQLEKAERQRQEVVESMQKSEKEHEEIVSSHKHRNTELNEKIQRLEKQVKLIKSEAQQQLLIMQDSMDREHNATITGLKAKILELSQSHAASIGKLKTEHEAEKEQITREQAIVQKEKAIIEMRDMYLEAVEKIREDVVKHISQSNEKAASTVKIQVLKERQLTARRLRRYYLKCLAHMLDKECDQVTKEKKLTAMERYLDNIPERDGSRSTTPSVKSATSSSTTPTPSETHKSANSTTKSQENDSATEYQHVGFRELQRSCIQTDSKTDPTASMYQNNGNRNQYRENPSVPTSRPHCAPTIPKRGAYMTSGSSSRTVNDLSKQPTQSWVTARPRDSKPYQSAMTYPASSIKNNSMNSRKPPVGVTDRRQAPEERRERTHSRGRSLESGQPVEKLRSSLENSFELGLCLSNPDLAPQGHDLSGNESFQSNIDNSFVTDPARNQDSMLSLPHFPVSDSTSNQRNSDDIIQKYGSKYAALAMQQTSSPVDDILNKYTLGSTDRLHDIDKMTPIPHESTSEKLNEPKFGSAAYARTMSKSTEFLNADTRMARSTATTPTGRYKYTPLRNILDTRGQSKSIGNLNTVTSEPLSLSVWDDSVDKKDQESANKPPKYKTPPEKLPAKTKYRMHNAQALSLQCEPFSQDISSPDQEGITPRADREVALFSSGRTVRPRPQLVHGASLPVNFQKSRDSYVVQRPIPLVTRQTQAP